MVSDLPYPGNSLSLIVLSLTRWTPALAEPATRAVVRTAPDFMLAIYDEDWLMDKEDRGGEVERSLLDVAEQRKQRLDARTGMMTLKRRLEAVSRGLLGGLDR